MTVVLWIINALLAAAFAAAGTVKLTRPMDALADMGMTWVSDTSEPMVRGIAAIELAGAVGVIVPRATGVLPGLTPLAAIGLACVMLGAMVVHLKRAEPVTPPLVLGALAVISATIGFALL